MRKCWCGNNKDLTEYSDEYVKCEKCGTLVTKAEISETIVQVEDEDKDLYGKNYWQEQMTELAGTTSLDEIIDLYLEERAVYWLQYLLKYCLPNPQTRIAEIGCGLGQFSYLLKQCGYSQLAFELSPTICQYVQDNLEVNISCSEFYCDSNSLDVVVAIDLVEHLIDPTNLMKKINKGMRQNGIFMIQTPCYDERLSYSNMIKEKPSFQKLLIGKEHTYLFSKRSITKLLNLVGFNHIKFEPAFFGDDYDMFIFASKAPLIELTNTQIEHALNKMSNGRLIKTIIKLWNRQQELENLKVAIENEGEQRLQQIVTLTKMLEESEEDRKARLDMINLLTRELKEVKLDSAERLRQIHVLTDMVKDLQVK